MAVITPKSAYASSWLSQPPQITNPYATLLPPPNTEYWVTAETTPVWWCADFGATASITSLRIDWESAYASTFEIQVSNDAATWDTVYSTSSGSGGNQTVSGLTGSGRFWRIYVTGGLAISPFCAIYYVEFTGSVGSSWCLPRSSAAANDSSEGSASGSIDGDITTRWGSSAGSGSWLQVDLGAVYNITSVAPLFEMAEADYDIQWSADGSTGWTTLGTGTGSLLPPTNLSGSARHIRLVFSNLDPYPPYVSLWELNFVNQPAAVVEVTVPKYYNKFLD